MTRSDSIGRVFLYKWDCDSSNSMFPEIHVILGEENRRRSEKISYLRRWLSFAKEIFWKAQVCICFFLHRLNLYLNKDLSLSVGVFNLIQKAYKPYPVKLYRETNEPVKTKTRMFNGKTGSLLLPSDTKRAQVTYWLCACFFPGSVVCGGDADCLAVFVCISFARSDAEIFTSVCPQG